MRSRIASARLTSRGIDQAVRAMRRRNEHQYVINVPLLTRLKPDLVVTQELCNVCAAGHPEVTEAIQQLPKRPQVISVTGRRFDELFESIEALGRVTQQTRQAKALTRRCRRDLQAIERRVKPARRRPTVWCAEWLDPLMAAGHWIPELIATAGGTDRFGRVGADSPRITWEEVRRYDPEVILVMPCSFTIRRTVRERALLMKRPGWRRLRAVREGRVFALDGSYFHHPGPRLVQGVRIMAALFHPDRFRMPPPIQAQALRP